MKHPVEIAVAPLKEEAIKRAEMEAIAAIARVASELEKVGWNINEAAPYPTYQQTKEWPRAKVEIAKGRYQFFHSLIEAKPGVPRSYRPGAPYIVQMKGENGARFIEMSKKEAASQYEAFVVKLVGKIGPAKKASLEGSHVWGFSILTVEKKGGLIERWKTTQIVNVSKLGKLFNQWPSRKMK